MPPLTLCVDIADGHAGKSHGDSLHPKSFGTAAACGASTMSSQSLTRLSNGKPRPQYRHHSAKHPLCPPQKLHPTPPTAVSECFL